MLDAEEHYKKSKSWKTAPLNTPLSNQKKEKIVQEIVRKYVKSKEKTSIIELAKRIDLGFGVKKIISWQQ